MSADWILVNIVATAVKLFAGLYKVIRVSALPDVELGGQATRKASPDMFHSLRQVVGCE